MSERRTRRADRPRARRAGRTRTVLAAVGIVALVPLGITIAAYSDDAGLGLAASGIGSVDRFDIGLVSSGTVVQGDGMPGALWTVEGAERLVPGGAIDAQVKVFNNSPRLPADTTMTVVVRDVTGPDITPHLRFTATAGDGTVLFERVAIDEATGSLGSLAARGAPALVEGDAFSQAAPGSAELVTVRIEYLDVPGVEALNGGRSALDLRFDASSGAS